MPLVEVETEGIERPETQFDRTDRDRQRAQGQDCATKKTLRQSSSST